MPSDKKKHVTTTVDKSDAEKVEKWLVIEGRSMGWFMRKAFYLMMKKHKI